MGNKLQDKVAIITGGDRSLGKSITLLLVQEGAKVVIAATNLGKMPETANEINSSGGTAIYVKTDVTKRDEVRNMVEVALAKFHGVDILVNNAGITRYAPLLEMSEKDWDDVIDVDLKGVFNCIQAVAPSMVEKKYGKIINITSAAAFGGFPNQINYAAAKAGVIALTRGAARELGKYGINSNAVAPSVIKTDITFTHRTEAEVEALLSYNKKISALKRAGEKEDVANTVLFLASDDSAFITGQTIYVEGGRTDYMGP
jgi:3-oxoacyl-[acyl-carrier protein] reductase